MLACCYLNYPVIKAFLKYKPNLNVTDWSGAGVYDRLKCGVFYDEKKSKICKDLLDNYKKSLNPTSNVKQTKTEIKKNPIQAKDSKIELKKSSIEVKVSPSEPKDIHKKENVIKKCSSCGKEASLKCGKCQNVYYCNQECQKKEWSIHKTKCQK